MIGVQMTSPNGVTLATQGKYCPSNVSVIPTLQSKNATPTAETQDVTADSGNVGLSKVTVQGDENLTAENIAVGATIFGVEGSHAGQKPEQGKNIIIRQNGTQTILPDEGQVLTSVDVTTAVLPDTQSKSITVTANGTQTVTPDSGKALSAVNITVNTPVPQPTQFTNVLSLATAEMRKGYAYNGTNQAWVALSSVTSVMFPIPNGSFTLRIRGVGMSSNNMRTGSSSSVFEHSVSPSWGNTYTIDEHGDLTVQINNSDNDAYLYVPLSTMYNSYFTFDNCIITINQPIGNGGTV